MKKLFIAVVCMVILAPSLVFSGPRWWWDDTSVTTTFADSTNPDVTLPVNSDTQEDQIFVVWEETPFGAPNPAVFLTASLDNGCSFCDPVQISTLAEAALNPAVAAAVLRSNTIQIQVAYEDNGAVKVAYLASPLGTANLSCASLSQAIWAYATVNGTLGAGSAPDIAAVSAGNDALFVSVWEQGLPTGGDDIYYAVNAAGDGQYAPPVNLTDSPFFRELLPAVSADSSPTGGPQRSAINIAYLSIDGTPEAQYHVNYQRSVDDGATFGPGQQVNATRMSPLTPPNIDSGDSKLAEITSLWHGISWMVPATATNPTGLFFNSQHNSNATTVDYGWQGQPERIRTPLDRTPVPSQPGVSVFPSPAGTQDSSFYVFWSDPEQTPQEIWYRGGEYALGTGDVIDIDTFPIDGSASSNRELTGIAPPRSAGGALTPASDEGLEYPPCDDNAAFVVWSDTQGSFADIYFKRIDTCIDMVPVTGQCNPGGGVILFLNMPICDAFPEKLTGMNVYYSLNSGGPYTLFTTLPGDEPSTLVTGLNPSTDYYFVVSATDEAGNSSPPNFNPDIQSNPPPLNEIMVFNGPPCAGVGASKEWVDVNGGLLLPLDTVQGTITVDNTSAADATRITINDIPDQDYLQNITPLDSGVFQNPNILWGMGDLPAGESASVRFTAQVNCVVPQGPSFIEIEDLTPICNDDYSVSTNELGELATAPPACLEVNRPVLSMTKTRAGTGNVHPGDTIQYIVSVCNEGSGAASTVQVSDTPDQSQPFFVFPPSVIGEGGTWNNPNINWTIPSVGPGTPAFPTCQSVTYSLQVSLTSPTDVQACNNASTTSETVYSNCVWNMPTANEFCVVISPGNPTTGACCFSDGSCTPGLTSTECSNQSGVSWHGGQNCAQVDCTPPDPEGACCLPDGSCEDNYTEASCTLANGTAWFQDQLCADVNCAAANELMKACCGADVSSCDRGSLFPLPSYQSIPAPPGTTTDTGLLNLSNRLCFYQVVLPTPGNSVRVVEGTNPDNIDIHY